MPVVSHPSNFIVPVPTMIFIDGGYLRRWLKDECKVSIDEFDFGTFSVELAEQSSWGVRKCIIVRTYFYDGIVDPTEPEYQNQIQVHKKILHTSANFEIRLGHLVKDGEGGFRQKGVDALLAIDMVDKANSDQYDIGIVVAGDLDHLEAIKTVRNKGKQVHGVYDPKTTSEKLLESFDRYFDLDKNKEGKYLMKNAK